MGRQLLFGSATACIALVLAAPLSAATATPPSTTDAVAVSVKPSETCWSDLRAFDMEMQKDGYWISGAGYGYGYPMMGGYDAPADVNKQSNDTGYRNVRPGYDVRTLVAAATILARNGKQQACEDTLTTMRDIYKVYISNMKAGKGPLADVPGWRARQLVAAQSIATTKAPYRSDQLIGTDVINLQNVALGSVEDLVMNPQTGGIAYMIIARGGVFGIDQKYVPVPWNDFKITPNGSLLVLDSKETIIKAAPMVSHDQFAAKGGFDQESKAVDDYWKVHISNDGTATTVD